MSYEDKAMRTVDLSEQIANRILHGFTIPPEDLAEAEELGIDVQAMEVAMGVYDEYEEDC